MFVLSLMLSYACTGLGLNYVCMGLSLNHVWYRFGPESWTNVLCSEWCINVLWPEWCVYGSGPETYGFGPESCYIWIWAYAWVLSADHLLCRHPSSCALGGGRGSALFIVSVPGDNKYRVPLLMSMVVCCILEHLCTSWKCVLGGSDPVNLASLAHTSGGPPQPSPKVYGCLQQPNTMQAGMQVQNQGGKSLSDTTTFLGSLCVYVCGRIPLSSWMNSSLFLAVMIAALFETRL